MGKQTLMYFLYTFFLTLLYPLLRIIFFLIPKYNRILLHRSLLLKKALEKNPKGKEVVWMHSASVGELDQSKAILQIFRKNEPNLFIIQTVYSQSVSEKNLDDPLIDVSFYLPFDLPIFYKPIFQHFKPKKLLIVAWDTWPNLLKTSKKYGVKNYLVCASLSASSSRKNFFMRGLTRESFQYLDGIYPTHSFSEKEFESFVSPKSDFTVLGDSRFDSVLLKLESKKPKESFITYIEKTKDFWEENPPIVFGSTYTFCEELILSYLQSEVVTESIWIFPHKWEKKRGEFLLGEIKKNYSCKKYSEVTTNFETPQCIIFDEMGILAFAYKYSQIAYVGGGFHHRIHNTIEPAAFGLPIFTGPKILNAPEALVMQSIGGLRVVSSNESFIEVLKSWTKNKEEAKKLGHSNRNFVVENRGASEKIYKRVFLNAKS